MDESYKMRGVRFKTFVREEESIIWLVDDLLPDVGWTLLIGRQGLGKSTFCLQLCDALQKGTPFLGRETKRVDCLYIQADSPTREWRAMVQSIAPDSSAVTIVDVPTGALSNSAYVKTLNTLINDKIQPGFIVWDSLYNLAGISVNNEKILDAIQSMKLLSGNRSCLLIHHPPHDELRSAGHHSIPANASRVWLMTKKQLKIDKGRLSSLKEIRMVRQNDNRGGLWCVEEDAMSEVYNMFNERPNL